MVVFDAVADLKRARTWNMVLASIVLIENLALLLLWLLS